MIFPVEGKKEIFGWRYIFPEDVWLLNKDFVITLKKYIIFLKLSNRFVDFCQKTFNDLVFPHVFRFWQVFALKWGLTWVHSQKKNNYMGDLKSFCHSFLPEGLQGQTIHNCVIPMYAWAIEKYVWLLLCVHGHICTFSLLT